MNKYILKILVTIFVLLNIYNINLQTHAENISINNDLNNEFINNEDQINTNSVNHINISGIISWVDEERHIHPAQNIYIEIYDVQGNNKNTLTIVETNDIGFYNASIPNLESDGYDIGICVNVEGANIRVLNLSNTLYKIYDNQIYSNCNNINLEINFEIDIDDYTTDGDKEKVKALFIHQGAIIGSKYVKLRKGSFLDTINIIYPTNKDISCFSNGKIHILESKYNVWDTVLHEYGHYVSSYYNIDDSGGFDHNSSDCLNNIYGKEEGMKLAWGEAWATYFSITSQLEMNVSSYDFCGAGDLIYGNSIFIDYDYTIETPNSTDLYGESNERSIYCVLYDLADDSEDDEVSLGFDYMWNLLTTYQFENFSEFMQFLQPETNNFNYIKYGDILSKAHISPQTWEPIYNQINEWDIPKFTFLKRGGKNEELSNFENNLFSLVFYKEDGTFILETQQTSEYFYIPTTEEWENICDGKNSHVYWGVKAYQTTEFDTGYYYSNFPLLELPVAEELENNVIETINLSSSEFKWFMFEVPLSGKYLIESSGDFDIYCEVYTNVCYEADELCKIEGAEDDNSGENNNFKLEINLNYNDVVFIKITNNNINVLADFNVMVSCIEHNHEFIYKPLNRTYHILKCHCGETSGTQAMHVVDPHSDNNITKKCKICGVAIIISDGDFYPVIGLNSNIVDLNLLNYEIESLKVVKKE